jgi:hypothetical protein
LPPGAAKLFGVAPYTVRCWASGESDAPIGVAMILRLMINYAVEPSAAYRLATGERL